MPLTSRNNDATAHRPAGEAAPDGEAADGNSQGPTRPKGDGGWRVRLGKMCNTASVPHEPALRFEGDWKRAVADQICEHWIESQKTHQGRSISVVALSRMKALDYERKHRADIPEDQCLLPGNPDRQDYYEAQMSAFLEAIGISGENLAALLESFKLAGTGGLHRQQVTVAAALNGLLGGAAQLLLSDPAAAAALYGARLLLLGVTAERTLDSGWQRLRNAGTEDVLPHGRADSSFTAKGAPTMFEAAHAVVWSLRGVKKNLSRMEAAKSALDDANAAFKRSSSAANKDAVKKAKQDLEVAFARICYQIELKISYKASSESAKIEFRGNQRYLATSYAGTTLTLGAGLFSILTPVLGVAAAPATGGVSIGAAAFVMLIYVLYQIGSGPSKDGEAKAKRAIVALTKSIDILTGDKVTSQGQRAAAYKAYIKERRAARFKFGEARTESRAASKARLLARLQTISRNDNAEDRMDSRGNWEAYRAYLDGVSMIEKEATEKGWSQQRRDAEIKQLEEQFQARHQADFSMNAIADAWKDPMRIRMDTASRLLKGKVAQSHAHLINLMRHPGLKARVFGDDSGRALHAARAQLREHLRDLFNLELALHRMKPLIDGSTSVTELRRAATAIGAIEDADVHNAFCGNAQQQIEAVTEAKKLTAGEAERYVYTNAGASLPGIGLNLAVGATDFSIGVAKATGGVHVGLYDSNPEAKTRIPKYNDYKFAAISQAGAPLAAHMNAGDRAAFQKTQMPKVLEITARPQEEHVELNVTFDSDISHFEDAGIGKERLDALVEQLANAGSVPDKIILSVVAPAYGASGSESTTAKEIMIDFRSTAAYRRALNKEAGAVKKLKVAGGKAGIVASHALMPLAGLPAQGLAQYNLRKTRAALNEASERGHEVRRALAADIWPAPQIGDGPIPSMPALQSGTRQASLHHADDISIEDLQKDPVWGPFLRQYIL